MQACGVDEYDLNTRDSGIVRPRCTSTTRSLPPFDKADQENMDTLGLIWRTRSSTGSLQYPSLTFQSTDLQGNTSDVLLAQQHVKLDHILATSGMLDYILPM
jgi:hypothetical protein